MAKKNNDGGKILGIAAAAAAAIAGAYFLYGKSSPKSKRKVRSWALKAKGEILERLEDMEHITQKNYNQVVDEVARGYRGLKNVDRSELTEMVSELKAHWESISKQVQTGMTKSPAKKAEIKALPEPKIKIKE